MRYRIDSQTVYAERAALSASRPALWLLAWIHQLPKHLKCLDYGCGRLRYSTHLANRVAATTVVDSRAQLSRTMTIHGQKCTIPEYVAQHIPTMNVVPAEDFDAESQFDCAICINVLSSIPSFRYRKEVCRSILRAVTPGGAVLFVNQHRNSYFKQYAERPGARQHLDGWLVPHGHGLSFYGLIPVDRLQDIINSCGWSLVASGCRGQSAFAFCSKGEASSWIHLMPDPRRLK